MQMLATVTRPTSGRILFKDIDIVKRPNELRRQLGYLPQDFGVYDNLTAFEFLSYFAALKGVHSKKRITEMLEMVNLHTAAQSHAWRFFRRDEAAARYRAGSDQRSDFRDRRRTNRRP